LELLPLLGVVCPAVHSQSFSQLALQQLTSALGPPLAAIGRDWPPGPRATLSFLP